MKHGGILLVVGLGISGALAACAGALGAGGDYELGGTGGAGGTTSSSGAASSSSGVTSSSSSGATSSSSSSSSGNGGAGGATSSSSSSSSTTSASSASSASSSSSSSSGAPASWHRYSFDTVGGTWSSTLLSSVWTGPNAPPLTGIVAATHLDHFDKLLIFADNGMFYHQNAGIWQPPVATQTQFPMMNLPIDSLYHVPSDWNVAQPAMPLLEGLTFLDHPNYFIFNDSANDAVTPVASGVVMNAQPPGPPQATGKSLWAFEIWNKSQIGTGEGFVGWTGYEDGNVYKFDAAFVWSQWPVESAPMWAGKPNAPNWSTLQAAYFVGNPANGQGTIVFIGP